METSAGRTILLCGLAVLSAGCQKKLHGSVKVSIARIENPVPGAFQDSLGSVVALDITNRDSYDWNAVRIELQCFQTGVIPENPQIYTDNRSVEKLPTGTALSVRVGPFPSCNPFHVSIHANEGSAIVARKPILDEKRIIGYDGPWTRAD
jgi:hypothetical protein